jgi:peptidyl-prolyl cis-trans isomerase D
VLGVTPSRDRTLDEVKDQVEAKWREEQIDERLKAKGTEIVKKLEAGGKLADEAAAAGVSVETAANFKREDTPAGVPATVVSAAFRTPKDGSGQTTAGVNQWIVFRVTNITVPSTDFASDDIKKLKDSLQRSLEDEQITEYVSKLETIIGTSINESALAQVTGENNN